MIPVIIVVGLALMALERLFPDQQLPHSPRWWTRVIIVNLMQAGAVWIGGATWDRYFDQYSVLDVDFGSPALEGLAAYPIVTFVFYWWHRWRHEKSWLWNAFHQVHHSPVRIETITSFYKHPLEICINSLIIGFTVYFLFGFDLAAGAWLTLYTAVAEFLYHMNIKTPHWLGYVFQRPEMHRIHHQRGRHYSNFSDLPIWDMLFGTYRNPPRYDGPCGFEEPREQKLLPMLMMRNVNGPRRKKAS